MIGVIAVLKVRPDSCEAFEAVFTGLVDKVRTHEPGNLMYQLTRVRDDPGVYKVLELYRDQEALAHHGQTDYFKAAGGAMAPFMAARPEIEYLDAV